MNYRQTCGSTTMEEKEMSLYTFRVNSLNDRTLSSGNIFVFIKKVQQHFFSPSSQAVLAMTERHSGRRQTAKVIIICGHAAPHLTDGDNLSQHFSIKKENTNKQRGRENTHSHAHKDVHTSWKSGNDLEDLIPH